MKKVCIIGSYAKALVMTADRIPLAGETLMGYDFRGTYGGKGSDMAVQSARLGSQVSYIGVVGDDIYGKEFLQLMKDENISQEGIRVTDKEATGVGFIVKDTAARNVIVVSSGANGIFSREDIDRNEKLIQEADVVLAQLEIPLDTAMYAMKKAKKAGKITILNPAPAVSLKDVDLCDVDILTPNETEAKVAAGLSAEENISEKQVAEILLSYGCKKVVMTLGDKGAGVFTADGEEMIPPYKIKVTDSNGAGDCFNASLASSLAEGKTLDESVAFANGCAALCCTVWETVPSYHTKEQVEAFMEEYRR